VSRAAISGLLVAALAACADQGAADPHAVPEAA